MSAGLTASDDTWVLFLNTFIDNPFLIFLLFVFIWFTILIYKDTKSVFYFLKSIIFRKKKITFSDLTNHQIFKDLDFFISNRINQLYNYQLSCQYDKAKILISHDLLLIKFTNIKQYLEKFIKETNFKDPYLNLRSDFKRVFEQNKSIQFFELKKLGIPLLFIEKTYEVNRIHEKYMIKTIEDILNIHCVCSNYEKMYYILNNLDIYCITILLESNYVIQSINGDLKGETYKGMVIGGNDYKCYPVPSKDYIPIVKERLQELALITSADRVSIYVIHDITGDDICQSYFSKIYEYENVGFIQYIKECQYKSTSLISEFIPNFKQHTSCSKTLTDTNELFSELLKRAGTKAVICYPLFISDCLRGFIELSYSNISTFTNKDNSDTYNILKKYSTLLNIYTDYTKTGFSYKNSST